MSALKARESASALRRESAHRFQRLRYRAIRTYYSVRRSLGGPDFINELDFWEETLRLRPPALFDREILEAAFPSELRFCAAELQREERRIPRLLELGSGPVSVLAHGVYEELFTVVAIDPLARAYHDLLEINGLSYPIRPLPGRGETLAKQFASDSFDLVYSSNALDHVTSPSECIEQICRVLRPGGFLLLEGFVQEGSRGNWSGLHQHDLQPKGGCLIHVDRSGRRSNLTVDKPLTCIIERLSKFGDRGIRTAGYDVPAEIRQGSPRDWRQHDWYTLLLRRD